MNMIRLHCLTSETTTPNSSASRFLLKEANSNYIDIMGQKIRVEREILIAQVQD
jgi:hypothetical protein